MAARLVGSKLSGVELEWLQKRNEQRKQQQEKFAALRAAFVAKMDADRKAAS